VEVHRPRSIRERQDVVHTSDGTQDRREQGPTEAQRVPGIHQGRCCPGPELSRAQGEEVDYRYDLAESGRT